MILHVENTSICNAACPMCERNVLGEGTTVAPKSLSMAQFSEINPSEYTKIYFCGNLGDPCGDNGLLDKISYIKSINPDCTVGINTNGSIQNPVWWTKCAALLSGRLDYVVFSIDGLEDTNHLHRYNVVWHKVINNARAFISAGGSAHWDMLAFAHNTHQIEQCKELARELGFNWFRVKETDRWDTFQFDNIKPASEYNYIDYNTVSTVQCERNIENSSYMDHKGNKFPCCYLADAYYSRFDIFNSDVKEVSITDLMTTYQERLDNNDPFYMCKRACGNATTKRSQWKTEIQLK